MNSRVVEALQLRWELPLLGRQVNESVKLQGVKDGVITKCRQRHLLHPETIATSEKRSGRRKV